MSKAAKAAAEFRDLILHGTLLAIDPSSGSYDRSTKTQSNVGYAIFKAGALDDSGIVALDGKGKKPVFDRLRDLHDSMRTQFDVPDIMVIEEIAGPNAHNSLRWSIPAIALAVRAPVVVEMNVRTWQSMTPKGYQKTDENDAIAIGQALIKLAKESK